MLVNAGYGRLFFVVLSYERDDDDADVVGDDLLHVADAGHGEEVEGGDGGDGAGEERDEAMATLLGLCILLGQGFSTMDSSLISSYS